MHNSYSKHVTHKVQNETFKKYNSKFQNEIVHEESTKSSLGNIIIH
jgi:hypothetical protein